MASCPTARRNARWESDHFIIGLSANYPVFLVGVTVAGLGMGTFLAVG